MRKAVTSCFLTGTLLVASGVLCAASTQAAPKRCLIGLTTGDGMFVAGAYDPKAGWQEDEKAKPWFTDGNRFSVYGQRAKVGDLTIKKVEAADGVGGYYADTTKPLSGIKTERNVNEVASESLLALSGATRPMPRLPRAQSLNASLYQREVARLLRKEGLRITRARLTQHWRVDLNGDGEDEVLLTACSRREMGKEPRALRGDYAIAALRFLTAGKVQTVPLAVDAYTRDRLEGAVAAGHFELMGCYDIDGDGQMEIALSTGYYEGFGLMIFKFDGKHARPVLSAGWGA